MDAIKPLMDLAASLGAAAGPVALVLWLYWQERGERRDLSEKLLKITVDQIDAEKEMTAALNLLSAKVVK